MIWTRWYWQETTIPTTSLIQQLPINISLVARSWSSPAHGFGLPIIDINHGGNHQESILSIIKHYKLSLKIINHLWPLWHHCSPPLESLLVAATWSAARALPFSAGETHWWRSAAMSPRSWQLVSPAQLEGWRWEKEGFEGKLDMGFYIHYCCSYGIIWDYMYILKKNLVSIGCWALVWIFQDQLMICDHDSLAVPDRLGLTWNHLNHLELIGWFPQNMPDIRYWLY